METKTDKGLKGGSCNVTSCQKPGANYYNKGTEAYYCAECAEAINWEGGRAETMRLFGTPLLCELEATAPDREKLKEWWQLAENTDMVSAVGEYTPDEFIVLLDAVDELKALAATIADGNFNQADVIAEAKRLSK